MPTPNPLEQVAANPSPAEFFVGIDSDGCAFDTMEVKHKECFIPEFVAHFGLAPVSRTAREVAEFVNLYSVDRGVNRFPGYLKTLDLLADRPEVARRGFVVPRPDGLRAWIARAATLSNPALAEEVARTGDPDLAAALAWSEAVNLRIAATVRRVPPFPLVRESLEALRARAHVMVVSATPGEALRREWSEHGLADLVASIAGQEAGTKRDVLAGATGGRYEPGKVLMIGDAPGDRRAAGAVGASFYPIDPGDEDASWERFLAEALPRFFAGVYAGAYEDERIARFESLLPADPPWGERPGRA